MPDPLLGPGAPTQRDHRPSPRRGVGLAVGAVALAAAVVAAAVSGPQGSVAIAGESISGGATTNLQRLSEALPFGYAFAAGMVAAVNPCGFALLPGYLGFYLGNETGTGTRFSRALVVSLAVSASFVAFFGVAGLLVGALSSLVAAFFPWAGLVVGIVLIGIGASMIGGSSVYTSVGDELASRLRGVAGQARISGYLAYGCAYALASLGCTLPVFLSVVGSAAVHGGLASGASRLALYGLGMASVLTVLTFATAALKRGLLMSARRLRRYVPPVSAALLLLSGTYVVYYWLALGGLFQFLRAA